MNIKILVPPTSVPRLTKMSKSAEEVSFRPALRGKWQQSPQTMQTIPPAAARVEMDQEEPEGARPTKLACGFLLHKLSALPAGDSTGDNTATDTSLAGVW